MSPESKTRIKERQKLDTATASDAAELLLDNERLEARVSSLEKALRKARDTVLHALFQSRPLYGKALDEIHDELEKALRGKSEATT